MSFHVHRLAAAVCAALSCAVLACAPEPRGVRVLVAGSESREGTFVAMLWDDGRAIPLDEEHPSSANAIAVAGSDVYVAGVAQLGEHSEAVYWRNGEVVRLTDGMQSSGANAIAVAGGSVYVAGYRENEAMLWKEGEAIPLTTGAIYAGALAMAVTESGVYVAVVVGEQIEVEPGVLETRTTAKLWVNGVVQSLTDGQTVRRAIPGAIAVTGSDVHVAMTTDAFDPVGADEAVLWTNGELQQLSGANQLAWAEAVALAGTDVIVGGSRVDFAAETPTQEPVIWRNGVLQVVAPVSGQITALATHGEDVYAGGRDEGLSVLWVNGDRRPIGDPANFFRIEAIAVQPR